MGMSGVGGGTGNMGLTGIRSALLVTWLTHGGAVGGRPAGVDGAHVEVLWRLSETEDSRRDRD